MADRIIHFYARPVSVNIKVGYNDTLIYPAVAICNSNSFRLTMATEMGLYERLDNFYNKPEGQRGGDTALDNEDLESIIPKLAHQREDLIRECWWGAEKCTIQDFKPLISDYGMCYVFNTDPSEDLMRKAQSTGTSHGLNLLLNTEQYETMAGPNSARGVRLLIYDQMEVERVADLGVNIPVFAEAQVGLQFSRIHSLRAPYGTCGKSPLKWHKYYTLSTCQREVLMTELMKRCKCVPVEMAVGDLPVCPLSKYDSCYLPATSVIDDDCHHPCMETMFTTDVSTTGFSESVTTIMANEAAKDKTLTEKYRKAKLTNEKVHPLIVTRDRSAIQRLMYLHARMINKTGTGISSMENLDVFVDVFRPRLKTFVLQTDEASRLKVSNFKYVINQELLGSYLQPNLVRLRFKIKGLWERTLKYLKDIMDKEQDRKNTLGYLESYFSDDISMVSTCVDEIKYTSLPIIKGNATVVDGKEIPRKKLEAFKIEIVEIFEKFIKAGLDISSEMISFRYTVMTMLKNPYNKDVFMKDFEKLQNLVDLLRKHFETFQMATTGATELIKKVCDTLLSSVTTLVGDEAFMGKELDNLEALLLDFRRTRKTFKSEAIEEMFRIVTDGLAEILPHWTQVTKLEAIRLLSPSPMYSSATYTYKSCVNLLTPINNKIVTKGTAIEEKIATIRKHIEELTTDTDPASAEGKLKQDALAGLTELDDNIGGLSGMLDASIPFLDYFEQYLADVVKFNSTLEIDEAFVRANFVALKIYYQRLSYTEIKQFPGYGGFDMMSDIGGSAGLFLGASFLTILELLYHAFRHLNANSRKPSSAKADIAETNTNSTQVFTIVQ
ncbi:uncharacterized protein LOC135486969 [Lineus longissimus]|uniref:uncharacterized protein LOC135486969 n=1 Tax=Lineus longissimus TaxID=88925 RepID=UPI00315D6F37